MDFFKKKEPVPPKAVKAVEEQTGIRIVRLRGSLDTTATAEIHKFVQKRRLAKDFEFKDLILDFQDVSFADSSAVAELVKTMFEYKKAHHTTVVINMNSAGRSVLEVLKLDKLIRLCPSESAAIEVLNQKARKGE